MGISPTESFAILYHEDMAAVRASYEGRLGLEVWQVVFDWFIGYWISRKRGGDYGIGCYLTGNSSKGNHWRA
jgi:hypothetical protein